MIHLIYEQNMVYMSIKMFYYVILWILKFIYLIDVRLIKYKNQLKSSCNNFHCKSSFEVLTFALGRREYKRTHFIMFFPLLMISTDVGIVGFFLKLRFFPCYLPFFRFPFILLYILIINIYWQNFEYDVCILHTVLPLNLLSFRTVGNEMWWNDGSYNNRIWRVVIIVTILKEMSLVWLGNHYSLLYKNLEKLIKFIFYITCRLCFFLK